MNILDFADHIQLIDNPTDDLRIWNYHSRIFATTFVKGRINAIVLHKLKIHNYLNIKEL